MTRLLTRSRALGAELDTMMSRGEYKAMGPKLDERERVLAQVATLKGHQKENDHNAWRNKLAGGAPIVEYQSAERGADGQRFGGEDGRALDRYLRTGEIDRGALTVNEGHVEIPEHMIMQVAQDPYGGYAVRPTLAQKALVDAQAQGALRSAGAPERICDGDSYEEVIVTGDTAEWAPEIPDGTENTNPSVKLWMAQIHKVRDLQFMTEQQREDQHVDLTEAVIFNSVDQARRMEDTGLVNGSGIGLEPLGMLNASDLVTPIDIDGTTANTVSNTAANLGSAPKLVTLMGQLPSRFHDGACWMMAGATFAAIRSLIDAEGRPYFPETFTGQVLAGHPVILNDAVPVGGTNGNKVVIFGNFARGFRIVRKPAGIAIRILNERFSDRDLIGIRMIYRVGGGAILPQAFRVGAV